LARERVAEQVGFDWDRFARAIVEDTAPGNNGNLMLPYFVPEMTPKILTPQVLRFGEPGFVDGSDRAALVRGVVEAQALSMQHHSSWIGETPSRLFVTGGASRNRGILQVLADVFNADIRTLSIQNSSALGAALRAAQAAEAQPWAELYETFAAPDVDLKVSPSKAAADVYERLRAQFVQRLATMT
jgi:xylulokinase